METTLFYAFDERKKGNWRSGSDFNFSCNLRLYIECIEDGKSLKNKLYIRYTQ